MKMIRIYLPTLVDPIFLMQLFPEQDIQLVDLSFSYLYFPLKVLDLLL